MGREQDLLDASRTGNISTAEKLLTSRNKQRTGPLAIASPFASLRRSLNPNCHDVNGDTPLHHAALNGHIDIVKLLLKCEASALIQDNKGCTPLHLAAWNNHAEICHVLLNEGPSIANLNEQNNDGDTALHCSAQYGNLNAVEVLLKEHVDPLIRNNRVESALELACLYGRFEVVNLLLRTQPHLLSDKVTTHSALHFAARNGHLLVVRLLLDSGFDINTKSISGSALHEAALFGKKEVVRLLIRKGIDVGILNNENKTAQQVIGSQKSQIAEDITQILQGYVTGFSPVCLRGSLLSTSSTTSRRSTGSHLYEELGQLHPTKPPRRSPSPLSQSFSAADRRTPSYSKPKKPIRQRHTSLENSDRISIHSEGDAPSLYDIVPPARALTSSLALQDPVYDIPLPAVKVSEADQHPEAPAPQACSVPPPRLRPKKQTIVKTPTGTPQKPPRRKIKSLSPSGGVGLLDPGILESARSVDDLVSSYLQAQNQVVTGSNSFDFLTIKPTSSHQGLESHTVQLKTFTALSNPRVNDLRNSEAKCNESTITSDIDCYKSVNEPQKPKQPPELPKRYSSLKSDTDIPVSLPTPAIISESPGVSSMDNKRSSNVQYSGNSLDNKKFSSKSSYETIDNKYLTGSERPSSLEQLDNCNRGSRTTTAVTTAATPELDNRILNTENEHLITSTSPCKDVQSPSAIEEDVVKNEEDEQKFESHHQSDENGNRHSLLMSPVYEDMLLSPLSRPDEDQMPVAMSISVTSMSSMEGDKANIRSGQSTPCSRPPSLMFGSTSKRNSREIPLSPTGYEQPPTPDHPPPSPMTAIAGIQEQLKPQDKRLSRDMETITENMYLVDRSPTVTEGRSAEEDSIPLPAVMTTSTASTNTEPEDSDTITEGDEADLSPIEAADACFDESLDGACAAECLHDDNSVEIFRHEDPFRGLTKGSIPFERRRRVKSQVYHGVSIPSELLEERKRTSAPGLLRVFDVLPEQDGCLWMEGKEIVTPRQPGLRQKRRSIKRYSAGLLMEGQVKDVGEQQTGSWSDGGLDDSSPIDENEEWEKIADIMASLGSGINTIDDEGNSKAQECQEEFQYFSGSQSLLSVGDWLDSINLGQYENILVANGFDDTDFMGSDIIEDNDLLEIGITDETHRQAILEASCTLPKTPNIYTSQPVGLVPWLQSLHLEEYREVFELRGFTTIERIKKLWELELNTVLDVNCLGHRRRMLASLHSPDGQDKRWSQGSDSNSHINLSWSTSPLDDLISEGMTSDIDEELSLYRDYTSIETSYVDSGVVDSDLLLDSNGDSTNQIDLLNIRPPHLAHSESPVKQWRHQPDVLIKGCCRYNAKYLGSTIVHQLQGTESTKESINRLKASSEIKGKVSNVILSISYKGVIFIEAKSKSVICEHEINNIFCACQDGDFMNYFAYITKDIESDTHFCHVFAVKSMALATEIILTLGEAFEIAYQIAIKEDQLLKSKEENLEQLADDKEQATESKIASITLDSGLEASSTEELESRA